MKIAVLALIGALGLAGTALAQPPQEITADDSIKLQTGQARTFEFDKAVERFSTGVDGIVRVTPLTDRTFTIEALRPGEVLAIVYPKNGGQAHHMNIAVEGVLIKIYGQHKAVGRDDLGYTSHYCSTTGCGRPNPDVVRGPNRITVSETENKGDGNSVTTSREYR